MGQIRIMGRTGDARLTWDTDNQNEVDAAEEMFDRLVRQHYVAFHVNENGKEGSVMKRFDPEAGKIIMVPPMSGG
jgi:hypothetical protein